MTQTAEKLTFSPLGDRVLIQPIEAPATTKSGIIIPEPAKEKPQEAKVIAAGKGKTTDTGTFLPMHLKPGDRILFGRYTGTEVNLNGEDLLVILQEDVLAIIS